MSNPSIALVFDCTSFAEWTQLVPVERMQLNTDALIINHAADSGASELLRLLNDAVGSSVDFIHCVDEGLTTRFLVNEMGSVLMAGVRTAIATKTANYTVTLNDHTLIGDTGAGGPFTMTLPAAGTCTGQIFCFKVTGPDDLTIDASGSEEIDGSTTLVLGAISDAAEIQSDGTGWIVLNYYTA